MRTTDTERPTIPASLIEPLVKYMAAHNIERVDVRLDEAESLEQRVVLTDDEAPDSLSRDAGVMVVVKVNR
ncbi:hypothetical protein AX769_21835 (plasmid) [Frondihabitans sp. PAMC 28766]|uniref:hypothetical protein n=1 Tax=Frondihabitans sp. PAMC 28766 TaxID=1795630 RepID=UPI00078BFEF0|nr:hypothetical protein [Frondihabitans sp. PAMC 28766]AMM22780.1 hypothetical protein AX769_21835 [Frondihabitans sp. PAMC 28766]